jgi:undecaprenyl-diphosphatase
VATRPDRPAPGSADAAPDGAAERAGLRLGVGLAGALVVLAAAVPLGVLVRADHPGVVRTDLALSASAERAAAGSDAVLLAARTITVLGDPVLLTLAAALLAWWLARRGSRRLALYVVVARVGAMVLSTGLKAAVDRARPVFDEPVATALGPSFPSGHALGAAAFYAALVVLLQPYTARDRLLLTGAVALSALVAASRVLLGVHYPSDVVAGLLIGLGWAALCTAVFAAWRADEGRPVDVVHEGIGTR